MRTLLGYFLTPAGLVLLGVLDSSLVFFLPLGIDVVLILLAARQPEMFWAYALLATAGSLTGAAGTYWLGKKAGEDGLARWIGKARIGRVRARVSGKAAAGVAALAIIPPPFPFTALLLASGAFALDVSKFFSTLAAVRLLRFGIEAALAARYGETLLQWMDSTAFEVTVGILIALALGGTAISAFSTFRSKPDGRHYSHGLNR
jgi:membrane protein YqaA with SNARE-associated domain